MEVNKWEPQEKQFAAIVIFCISFTGTLGNWLVATCTQRFPSMQNSFGLLLASQSAGEAMLCSTFAFFYSPMVFFNIDSMEVVSRRAGIILLICYDICIFSHLFIALNRMCAICRPLSYDIYFSKYNTKIFIAITWTIALTRCLISYGVFDCDFLFDDSILAFVFTQTEDCKFISSYLDFSKDLTIVVIIATLDIIAVINVHLTNVKSRRTGQHGMDQRRKKEISFLKQAVLQGMVFVVELYTYFHLAWKYENRWAVWILTTVAWSLVHCSDSLIIIGFNAEFRKMLASPWRTFKMRSVVQTYTSSGTAEK